MSKILPLSQTVEAGGETLTISEFSFGQIPKVAQFVTSIFSQANVGQLNLADLVAGGGEDLMQILVLATGKPRSWFDTLHMADGVALAAAVVEVNQESFAKNVKPAASPLMAKLLAKVTAPAPVSA